MRKEIETVLQRIAEIQTIPRRIGLGYQPGFDNSHINKPQFLAYNETIGTLKMIAGRLTEFCKFLREYDEADSSRDDEYTDEYTDKLSEMLIAIFKIFTDRWELIQGTNSVYFEIYDTFTQELNGIYQSVAQMVHRVIKKEFKVEIIYCKDKKEIAKKRRECSESSSLLVGYLICLKLQDAPPRPFYIVSRNLQNEVRIERKKTHPKFEGERAWTEVLALHGHTIKRAQLTDVKELEWNAERILRSQEKVVDFFELKGCCYQIRSSPLERRDIKAVAKGESVIFEHRDNEWFIHFHNAQEKKQRQKQEKKQPQKIEEIDDIRLLNGLILTDRLPIIVNTKSDRDALKQMATSFGSSTHQIHIVDYQTKEEQNEAIISARKTGYLKTGFFNRYRGLKVNYKNSIITFCEGRFPTLLMETEQKAKSFFSLSKKTIKVINDFRWYKLEKWITQIYKSEHASNEQEQEQEQEQGIKEFIVINKLPVERYRYKIMHKNPTDGDIQAVKDDRSVIIYEKRNHDWLIHACDNNMEYLDEDNETPETTKNKKIEHIDHILKLNQLAAKPTSHGHQGVVKWDPSEIETLESIATCWGAYVHPKAEELFENKVRSWKFKCSRNPSQLNHILLAYDAIQNKWYMAIKVGDEMQYEQCITDLTVYGLDNHTDETLAQDDALKLVFAKIAQQHDFKQNTKKKSTENMNVALKQLVRDYINDNHHQFFHHWLQILIPTIAITDLELLEEKIDLCEYMLSRDNRHIFHIDKSIEALMKKGELVGVDPRIIMNHDEKNLLLRYGLRSIRTLIAACEEQFRFQVTKDLSTFYGHVKIFAEGLLSGSKSGWNPYTRGQEYDSGVEGDKAVIRFGEFLRKVYDKSKADHTTLMGLSCEEVMPISVDSRGYHEVKRATIERIWYVVTEYRQKYAIDERSNLYNKMDAMFCLDLLNPHVTSILDRNERWLRGQPIDCEINVNLLETRDCKPLWDAYTEDKTVNHGFWRKKGIYDLHANALLEKQAIALDYLFLRHYGNWAHIRNEYVGSLLNRYNTTNTVQKYLINIPSIRITIIHRITGRLGSLEDALCALDNRGQFFRWGKSPLPSLFLRELLGPRCVASCIAGRNVSQRFVEIFSYLEPEYRYVFLSQMGRKIINAKITVTESIRKLISLMPEEHKPLVITKIFKFKSLLWNCVGDRKVVRRSYLKPLFKDGPSSSGILTVIPMKKRFLFLVNCLSALKKGSEPWYLAHSFFYFLTTGHSARYVNGRREEESYKYSTSMIYKTIIMMLIYLPIKMRSVFFNCFFLPLLMGDEIFSEFFASDARGLKRIVRVFNEKDKTKFFKERLPEILEKVVEDERGEFSEAIRETPPQVSGARNGGSSSNRRGSQSSNHSPALLGPASSSTVTMPANEVRDNDDALTM